MPYRWSDTLTPTLGLRHRLRALTKLPTPTQPDGEIMALGAYPLNVLDQLSLLADERRLPEAVRWDVFVA